MRKGEVPLVADQDSAYRRGTVLGLTVAEVFILLLFLLMLAFLALAQEWQTEADRPPTEPEEELKKVGDKLKAAESALADVQQVVQKYRSSIRTPDEVVPLEAAGGEPREAPNNPPEDGADRLPENLREIPKRVEDVIREAQRRAKEADERARRAEAAAQQAKRATERVEKTLGVLREKGHNPPCWYEEVSDGGDGTREKPYYTFDVAVFDDSMILRRVPTPPGGATGDEDSPDLTYAEEAEKLPLDRIPYGVPLDDAAVAENLRPIHDAGKEEQVRSYSCIFWARVWDETSPAAKERWKSAHDGILESMLGTYTVSDDPWQE